MLAIRVSSSINRLDKNVGYPVAPSRANSTLLAPAVAHPREGPCTACLEQPCLWVPQASGGVVYAKSAGSSSIYVRVEQSTFTGNSVSGIDVRARTDSVVPWKFEWQPLPLPSIALAPTIQLSRGLQPRPC